MTTVLWPRIGEEQITDPEKIRQLFEAGFSFFRIIKAGDAGGMVETLPEILATNTIAIPPYKKGKARIGGGKSVESL